MENIHYICSEILKELSMTGKFFIGVIPAILYNRNIMKKFVLSFCILLCLLSPAAGQSNSIFTHYTTDDGLPQFIVMDILQDKKGFMWFGTWDGLSKFDGYQFRNYKSTPTGDYIIKNNRVQEIFEGKYNNLWFESYDEAFHCLNTSTEKFWGLQKLDQYKGRDIVYSGINLNASGKVWLLLENDGCVEVCDSLYNVRIFNKSSNLLKSNTVNKVFEDNAGVSWILTNNGMVKLNKDDEPENYYFYNENTNDKFDRITFFDAFDANDHIYFAANKGRLYDYSRKDGKFTVIQFGFSSSIVQTSLLSNGELLLRSPSNGLVLFNYHNGSKTYINGSTTQSPGLNEITGVFPDKSDNVWLQTSEIGIYRLDLTTRKVRFYKPPIDKSYTMLAPALTFVIEDVNGKVWVQPQGGGFSQYNKDTEELDPFYNAPGSANRKFSNILHSAFSDKQGNLWFCARSNGLDKVVFSNNNFKIHTIGDDNQAEYRNDVRAAFQDDDGLLWIATKDRKVQIYDENKKKLGCIDKQGNLVGEEYFNGMVYAISQDSKGYIWLGTKGEGLYRLKKTSRGHYQITVFRNDPHDPYSLSSNAIYTIFEDKSHQLWVGTYGGGINLYTDKGGKGRFLHSGNQFKNYPIRENYKVRYITESKEGLIYVGTTSGLIVFPSHFGNPSSLKFHTINKVPGTEGSIGSNDVHEVLMSQSGEIYVATFGGGICKVVSKDKNGYPTRFKTYTKQDGMPSDIVLALTEDEQGFIWATNENSLTKFNPEKESFENYSQKSIQLRGINFEEAANCRLKSNELIFGSTQGFLSFFPGQIINGNFKPYIAITNFQIFYRDQEKANKSTQQINVDNLNELKLTHNQKYFNISYAALDFEDPDNILYAYKLEGFDNDWNYVQKQRTANYTNLPKGKYVFKVKSTNSEGVWMDNERELQLIIMPSFWETGWATALYVLFLGALLFVILRILLVIYRLRHNVVVEKRLAELKLRFFTDISHEIRTPLTMITAPIDHLLNNVETSEDVSKHLRIISQNTQRLLRLVNQILDFRKIQFVNLKVSEQEISTVVSTICDNFTDIALSQKNEYHFINEAEGVKLFFDEDCVDKILMNLLSNAFKYTPSGKSVTVKLTHDDKAVHIEVRDEGIGIPEEKKRNLFTRFASFNNDPSKPSTGIGLSMVKDLVDKHGASVEVESELGKGTSVVLTFPFGIEHFDDKVEIITSDHPTTRGDLSRIDRLQTEEVNDQSANSIQAQTTILIVEDDNDLRTFVRDILKNDYLVLEAEDGRQGLDLAKEHVPDIIMSDIMMPNMDGVEMLRALREDIATSHIPVILLTAKTNIESKLEGLEHGADDYITKPFSVQYINARIQNLIQQRKRLQEIYRGEVRPKYEYDPDPLQVNSKDEEFIDEIVHTVEDNMDNFEFSVEELCNTTHMSRSTFFKKVKSLTGLSPVEFIRDIKMKKAAQLLSSGQFRVKEITYMIGISDSRYFSKCFKDKYGMTPLEYKNKGINSESRESLT